MLLLSSLLSTALLFSSQSFPTGSQLPLSLEVLSLFSVSPCSNSHSWLEQREKKIKYMKNFFCKEMVGRVATWVQITQQTRNTWDGLTQWILEPGKNKLSQHTPTSKILTYDKWFGKAIGLAFKFDFFWKF